VKKSQIGKAMKHAVGSCLQLARAVFFRRGESEANATDL